MLIVQLHVLFIFCIDVDHFVHVMYLVAVNPAVVGQRIGWGVYYNPRDQKSQEFDELAQQLVLIYVTIDVRIVYASMVMQPEGGWYPTVTLTRYGELTVQAFRLMLGYIEYLT